MYNKVSTKVKTKGGEKMNRKIIAVLMLVLTISFLLMGALYGKTAETQKGIEVSFGTMVDGEFVSNETGTLGGNQRKYEILQSSGKLFYGLSGVTGIGFVLSLGVKQLLDEMADLKMNVFHWHLTNDQGWRIEIKKYPKLTEIGAFRDSSEINHFGSDVYDGKRHGGFYTQEDLKEIVDYAAKRHITIIPEVSMPGHASAAIASYPWLGTSGKQIKVPGKFGVHYEVFNVADPDVMKFLDEVTDEVIAIFPGSVFHIGGDEVKYDQWKNSPAIRAYMTKHNLKTPAELQVYFTNEISNMLAAKGKRMMGWNEITGDKLHEYQSDADTEGVKQELASGTIVHFWKGDTALIRKTIEKGYDVVNSYHEYTYLDYSYVSIPMEKAYSFNPVPEGLTDDQKSKVLGLGCQMWGEFIPTVESMNLKVYPRLAAYAETGWTDASNKDYQRFLDKLNSFLQKWKTEGITCGPVQ